MIIYTMRQNAASINHAEHRVLLYSGLLRSLGISLWPLFIY
jgi:hypothetical protein